MNPGETLALLADPGYRLPLLAGALAMMLLGCLSLYAAGARLLVTGIAYANVAGCGAALALIWPVPPALSAMGLTLLAAWVTPLLRLPALPLEAGLLVLFIAGGAGAQLLASTAGTGDSQLIGLLNGQLLLLGAAEALALGIACLITVLLWLRWRTPFLLQFTQPAYAATAGVPVTRLDQGGLLVLALAAGAAFPALGVLCSIAALTAPGLIALLLARNLRGTPVIALTAAFSGYALGIVLAFTFDWPPGPAIAGVLALMTIVAGVAGRRRDHTGAGRLVP